MLTLVVGRFGDLSTPARTFFDHTEFEERNVDGEVAGVVAAPGPSLSSLPA